MNLSRFVFKWDNIVIGHSMKAILYAYVNKFHLILNGVNREFALEPVSDELLNILLPTNNDLPDNERDFCDYMIYDLSLCGLNPLSDKVRSIRFGGSNQIKVLIDGTRHINIKYKNLFIFDGDMLEDVPFDLIENIDYYKVRDWFIVRKGVRNAPPILYHNEDDSLAYKIHTYKVEHRSVRYEDFKDICVESKFFDWQLNEPENQFYMSRLKTLGIIRDFYKSDNAEIEFKEREIIPVKHVNIIDYGNIHAVNYTIKEIIKKCQKQQI